MILLKVALSIDFFDMNFFYFRVSDIWIFPVRSSWGKSCHFQQVFIIWSLLQRYLQNQWPRSPERCHLQDRQWRHRTPRSIWELQAVAVMFIIDVIRSCASDRNRTFQRLQGREEEHLLNFSRNHFLQWNCECWFATAILRDLYPSDSAESSNDGLEERGR